MIKNINGRKKLATFGLSISFCFIPAIADVYDDFKRQLEEDYNNFKQQKEQEYTSFRDKLNDEYARALADPWKLIKSSPSIKAPQEPSPEPDINFDPNQEKNFIPEVIMFDNDITPPEIPPAPMPEEEIPKIPVEPGIADIHVTLYGTPIKIPGVASPHIDISSADSKGYADGWRSLSQKEWNNLINDCLEARQRYKLSDWAYLRLLDKIAANIAGDNNDKHTLLMGYLLNQSGYDIRFCQDRTGKLHLLLASVSTLYDRSRFALDGKNYYPYTPCGDSVYICEFSTPGERPVTMALREVPALDFLSAGKRDITVYGHPEIRLSVDINKNLLDFYSDFPDSALGDSQYSRWSVQADTPVSDEISGQVYPVLKEALKGLNQRDAVNLLLKVAQSFEYGYDEELWGKDRVFWQDESWFYPYSDCEDHAINFTRMVRDILGLDCCLIYYPGHISSGVAITDGSGSGDYLDLDGKRFFVCDATYFYADAGHTAPSNKSQQAIPIRLDK